MCWAIGWWTYDWLAIHSQGFNTIGQAIYVPADDLTDPA